MKRLKLQLIGYAITLSLLTVYLFDKDGAQLGLLLYQAPDTLVQFISVIGNVAWLLGLFYLVMGIAIAIMYLTDKTEELVRQAVDKNVEKGLPAKDIAKRSIFDYLAMSLGFVVSVIGIGSGFWFTGTSVLAFGLISLAFMRDVRKYAREKANEGNPGATTLSGNPLTSD